MSSTPSDSTPPPVGGTWTPAPPGWYRDPWGVAAERWWDGRQWTGVTSAAIGPNGEQLPTASAPSLPPSGSTSTDKVMLWYLAAVLVVDLLLLMVLVGSTGADCSDPNLGQPNGVTGVASLVWLVVAAATTWVAVAIAGDRDVGAVGDDRALDRRLRTARVCAAISWGVGPLAVVMWIITGMNCGL